MRCHICDNIMEGAEIRPDPNSAGPSWLPCYSCSSEIAELAAVDEPVIEGNPYNLDIGFDEDETIM